MSVVTFFCGTARVLAEEGASMLIRSSPMLHAAAIGRNETAPQPRRVRGLVVARQQATISAALPSTILTVGPENGERFQRGTPLVTFDCRIYSAELARAHAIAEAAADTGTAKAALVASGSVARLQTVLAEAELKKARADVLVAEARVAHCTISAPYAGRVVRRIANAHETVAPRDPLIEIVDDSAFEVRAFVPSLWIGGISEGTPLRITIDETGEVLALATISVGAAIDNVSQLIEVRTAVKGSAPRLVAGMSGTIERLDQPQKETATAGGRHD